MEPVFKTKRLLLDAPESARDRTYTYDEMEAIFAKAYNRLQPDVGKIASRWFLIDFMAGIALHWTVTYLSTP